MVRASARRLAVLGRALLPPAPLPAAEAEAEAEAAPDGGVLTAQQCEHFRTFGCAQRASFPWRARLFP